MKKITVIFLVLCMSLSTITVFAAETISATTTMAKNIYHANIAFFEEVNETGTNINDESINGSSNTMPSAEASISISNNIISISTNINNTSILFTGIPTARSESGNTVFFAGTSNNSSYEIVNFAYVMDLSTTNMYFKSTKAEKFATANTMLKLYIKDSTSNTKDYYFIEIFDVNLNYCNDYVQSLEVNPLLGAWVVKEFDPIDETFGIDTKAATSRASASTRNWYCTQTFHDMGEEQTHTIAWRTSIDYSDVISGQQAAQYYRLTVYSKVMNFSINTDLNSNTSSFLHIDGIRLAQTSIPYTAWKSTFIDGEVQNNSISSGVELSASIGASYGALSVSFSIPLSFQYEGVIDINETYQGYENGVGGQYARSISTEMKSNYILTQIGQYFEVVSVLRDYGNTATSVQSLKSVWYVDILNAATSETCSHTCSHNVYISVVD